MRIAILGTRGIPATYGGFETFAEELSTRLAEKGHHVAVYCRQRSSARVHRGVELVYLPTLRHKYLDTIVHTALSTAHLLSRRFDALLYCNAANAIFTPIPRLLGTPVALNVDGLESNRRKWNALGRAWYRVSERLSTWCPSRVVTDAEAIRSYYQTRYRKSSTFIPYGATVGKVQSRRTLAKLSLEPGRYILYVSRLEPENNALAVRQAFENVVTDLRLVMVGDAPYAASYIRDVKDTTDRRILFPGAIYGEGYAELQSHCAAYVQATEVGGTHPALIEAMGREALVLYLETPENTEVADSAAVPFTMDNLSHKLQWAADSDAGTRAGWGARAAQRIRERYSWDSVTAQYEALFIEMNGGVR